MADGMTSVVSSSTSFWRVWSSCSEFLQLSNSLCRNLDARLKDANEEKNNYSTRQDAVKIKKDTVVQSRSSGSWPCTAADVPPHSTARPLSASSPPPCRAASGRLSPRSEPHLWKEVHDGDDEGAERGARTQTDNNNRSLNVRLPFKICLTIFFVSTCWLKSAWCSSFTRFSFSSWLLLMKATSTSPVSSRSWNLWPWAIAKTPAARKQTDEMKLK